MGKIRNKYETCPTYLFALEKLDKILNMNAQRHLFCLLSTVGTMDTAETSEAGPGAAYKLYKSISNVRVQST